MTIVLQKEVIMTGETDYKDRVHHKVPQLVEAALALATQQAGRAGNTALVLEEVQRIRSMLGTDPSVVAIKGGYRRAFFDLLYLAELLDMGIGEFLLWANQRIPH